MAEQHSILDEATTEEVLNDVAAHYQLTAIDKVDDAMIADVLQSDKEDDSGNNGDVDMTDSQTTNEAPFARRCKAILDDAERLKEVRMALYGWCGARGYTALNTETGGYMHLPTSLFPHLIPLSEWLELRQCSLLFHKLIDAMSRDSAFLLSRMKCIAEADASYTGKFYAIYQKLVEQHAFRKKYTFNSLRVDYMRNANRNGVWCQIEAQFTPGAPGFVQQGVRLHQYLCEQFVMQRKMSVYDTSNKNSNCDKDGLYFVPNDMAERFCDAMATAAKLMHPAHPLVLIVADGVRQDLNMIQLTLWENHGIPCIFRTYAEIGRRARIEDGSFDLIVDGKHRVSFVYCRGGSKREEWTDEEEMDWKGRELIEFSSAICDCNIAYTLLKLCHEYVICSF